MRATTIPAQKRRDVPILRFRMQASYNNQPSLYQKIGRIAQQVVQFCLFLHNTRDCIGLSRQLVHLYNGNIRAKKRHWMRGAAPFNPPFYLIKYRIAPQPFQFFILQQIKNDILIRLPLANH